MFKCQHLNSASAMLLFGLLLLFGVMQTCYAAPATHLAVIVDGDTPMLVVTSAEIGITPKLLPTTSTAVQEQQTTTAATLLPSTTSPAKPAVSITPSTVAATTRNSKSATTLQLKPKGKATKSQYAKKLAAINDSKQQLHAIWQTLATPTNTPNTATLTSVVTATSLAPKLNNHVSATSQTDAASVKKTTANKRPATLKQTNSRSAATNVATIATTITTTMITTPAAEERSENAPSATATAQTTSITLAESTAATFAAKLRSSTAKMTTTTDAAIAAVLAEQLTLKSTAGFAPSEPEKLVPPVEVMKHAAEVQPEIITSAATTFPPPSAPLSTITIETVEKATSKSLMPEAETDAKRQIINNKSHHPGNHNISADSVIESASFVTDAAMKPTKLPEQPEMPKAVIQTNNTNGIPTKPMDAAATDYPSDATTESPIVTTKESAMKTIVTSAPQRVGEPEALPPSDCVDTTGALKLIDLEELHHATETQRPPATSDVTKGHDGIKSTKKKQLLIEHYTATATTNAVKIKPTTTTAPQHHTTVHVEKLLPVHRGYLGPIHMEEKTFSIIHHAAPTRIPHTQHGSSIESQLRDGRIVEIIAPKALLQQGTEEEAATAAPPTPSPTAQHGAAEGQSPMLSATVFQVGSGIGEATPSTTRLPLYIKQSIGERTESKISDIQIEIYDSTIDSIVASTNFKDSNGFFSPAHDETGASLSAPVTPRVPGSSPIQERFTQYVVDRIESSTQRSSLEPINVRNKPEPAAIEIHINVSEAMGNESEDLEFAYRQTDAKLGLDSSSSAMKTSKPNWNGGGSGEHNEEILVVEIIDTGDNITENSASVENVNPIFTFRSESDGTDLELKDIRYYPKNSVVKAPQIGVASSDEIFMADLPLMEDEFPRPPPPPPPPPRKQLVDRDSDTIFYISNTEVKVGESLPTASTNLDRQLERTRFENQFFPASTEAPKEVHKAFSAVKPPTHRYEEDIILSPLHHTADSLKIFRSQGDGAPPLDVTYVGESIIEVEQSSDGNTATTTTSPSPAAQMTDIIIQPAILPEMSIGVPVIGELPPQIELKEIDFIPDETNGLYASENDIEEHGNDLDTDHLVESSIQYGGDLIDENARAGFDGIEGSYPFGNPHRQGANYVHYSVNHGVSHLRKDELTVDVGGSGERVENATLIGHTGNETLSNASYGVLSDRFGNGTAFAGLEDQQQRQQHHHQPQEHHDLSFNNMFSLIIGLFVVLLPVVITVSMACGLRYLYGKYRPNGPEADNNDEEQQAQLGIGNSRDDASGEHADEYNHAADAAITTTERNGATKQNPSNSSNSSLKRTDEKSSENIYRTRTTQSKNAGSQASSTMLQQQLQYIDSVRQEQQSRQYPTGPNGSVTKMTLKNNHLIVETEERNDISRNARETKMHYNTADKDGVFMVEVSRGIDSKVVPDSPVADCGTNRLPTLEASPNGRTVTQAEQDKLLRCQEEVQIHQPPPETPVAPALGTETTDVENQRSLHQIEEVEEPTPSPNAASERNNQQVEPSNLMQQANTGLSQSDLSSTSSADSNKQYTYGNQELYVIENAGYATISMGVVASPENSTGDTIQDDDRKSENGHSLEHSPSQAHDNNTNKEQQSDCNLTGKTTGDLQSQNSDVEGTHKLNNEAIIEEKRELPPLECAMNSDGNDVKAAANSHAPGNVTGGTGVTIEPEPENGYDSIMSLPAPPSTEEIKQLNDLSAILDVSQLDSLPPPPPPLLSPPAPINDTATVESDIPPAPLTPIKSVVDPPQTNGHVTAAAPPAFSISALPPPSPPAEPNGPSIDQLKANGDANVKMMPTHTTLTPPASPPPSPPPSPPVHFSNGPCPALPTVPVGMAVDVNGS